MISYVVLLINTLPVHIVMSSIISPQNIMNGTNIDYNRHCRLYFGTYAKTHGDNLPTNSNSTLSETAI